MRRDSLITLVRNWTCCFVSDDTPHSIKECLSSSCTFLFQVASFIITMSQGGTSAALCGQNHVDDVIVMIYTL